MAENTSVKVCVRVRPLLAYEKEKEAKYVAHYPTANAVAIFEDSADSKGSIKSFTYDYVFRDNVPQVMRGKNKTKNIEGYSQGGALSFSLF